MSNQTIDNLTNEIASADAVLTKASDADPTLRALLADRFFAERQMLAIREWLPRAQQQIDELKQAIVDLETENAALRAASATPVQSDVQPVADINQRRRTAAE